MSKAKYKAGDKVWSILTHESLDGVVPYLQIEELEIWSVRDLKYEDEEGLEHSVTYYQFYTGIESDGDDKRFFKSKLDALHALKGMVSDLENEL